MAVAEAEVVGLSGPEPIRSGPRRPSLAVLGLLPFLAYAGLFLILPAVAVLVGAFRNNHNHWTTANLHAVVHQSVFQTAFRNDVELSLETALVGGLLGVFVAYAALHPRGPRIVRSVVSAFSAIASQFGGVPLALFFIASLGNLGVVTQFIYNHFHYDLYARGVPLWSPHYFAVYSYHGLVLAYVYFQIPLMVIVIAPAIEGLKSEWREAAENLGASAFTYWRRVGIPVLMPSFLGALILLFGNAFAAQATASALTAGAVDIVPLQISYLLNGNVESDPHVAYALAFGMIVVIAIMFALYLPLARRAARWRA